MPEFRSEVDREAAELLAPLSRVNAVSSTLDIPELLRQGRRRAGRRRAATTATAGALSLLLMLGLWQLGSGGNGMPGPQESDPRTHRLENLSCVVEKLPVPEHSEASALLGADPTGRYQVGTALREGRVVPLRWTDGKVEVLRPPGGTVVALTVNAAGAVAGTSTDPANEQRYLSWRYADGAYSLLAETGELAGFAGGLLVQGVNKSGDIVAVGVGGTSNTGVAVWPGSSPDQPRLLPLPAGVRVGVAGIDDDGTVVAGAGAGHAGVALRWSPGRAAEQLELPPGAASADAFMQHGGQILGQAPAEGRDLPVVWDTARTGRVTFRPGLLGGHGVNAQGWVAGVARDTQGMRMPALADADRTMILPVTAPVTDPSSVNIAIAASDDGTVVSGQLESGSSREAVRWLCG